ncbi:DICT sensory domain-containing protein [Microseira wollei]|uniref:DICT sensory domain-containing protein n=1 Tax=Microseira wollei TaxID=467598 RepID=UPI001CFE7958|nr:DICT sensory domain-containing protein [Microseira wollei]
MSIQTSVLAELLQDQPQLRPQMYFKSSLTALSHGMEDLIPAHSKGLNPDAAPPTIKRG